MIDDGIAIDIDVDVDDRGLPSGTVDVSLEIQLLGAPRIVRDGVGVRGPRGHKSWALLAYLLLAERPVSRRHLAEVLFPEADDPLGSLRWTLAEVRRTLGCTAGLRGDPVSVDFVADEAVEVDVLSIMHGAPEQLLDVNGELLEGVSPLGCPRFESWLVVERFRLSAAIEARIREAALGLLAAGRPAEAVGYASRVVTLNALDEENQELLVRCLAAAGDETGAQRQAAVAEDLLRRDLGVEPSPALRSAATARTPSGRQRVSERAEAEALIDAGRAAVSAGAVDSGMACLYRAADMVAGEPLHAAALVALGGALVHGVRGRDGEGSVVLHEAVGAARRSGDRASLVTAFRELGFVDVQAGRRRTAAQWLDRAAGLAGSEEEQAAVLAVQGMNASDMADYPDALRLLGLSADLAGRCGDTRQEAWSLALVGRAHLLRDERSQAGAALRRSLDLIARDRWMAFLPWPQALKAELDLLNGDEEAAAEQLQRGWALSCQIGDPCWEGITGRCLGLLSARRGDGPSATDWFDEAHRRCTAVTDRYQWLGAYVLDAAAGVAAAAGDRRRATQLLDQLAPLAARCEMRELVVRSHLHRWTLGDRTARDTGRALAADLDNPALHAAFA